MKHKYIIFAILFVVLSIQTVYAQVSIGSDAVPESYSIVQVEGKKGMRLPRITEIDKNNLDNGNQLTNNPKSIGLTVYNETNKVIEYWNGSAWIALKSDLEVDNGLQSVAVGSSKEIRFGGTLNKATMIDLNDKRLNIKNNASTEFSINSSVLKVKDKEVSIGGNLFSVNNIFKVEANTTTISPSSKLSVNGNTFVMDNNNTSITGVFQYADGTQSLGHLLTCDTQGKSHWEPLKPIGAVSDGAINNQIAFSSGGAIVSSVMTLAPGQWMIFAKYTGHTLSTSMLMYHWATLVKRKAGSGGSWTAVTNSGSTPEYVTAGTSTYSTPSFVYYLNITERSEFAIQAGSSNSGNTTTYTSDGGKSYFYALRIDMPE